MRGVMHAGPVCAKSDRFHGPVRLARVHADPLAAPTPSSSPDFGASPGPMPWENHPPISQTPLSMFALFDDAGKFLAGRVMSEADASMQIELDSGKRVKAKAANVLIKFAKPAPAELLAQAAALATDIDVDLVWETAPDDEFGFDDLAREYFSATASAVEQAAMLMRLFETPHYFHRRGKGRFRKAPEDILKQALVAIERKKQQALQIAEWAQALAQGQCPQPIKDELYKILFKPDKNSLEYKALDAACTALGLSPMRLMVAVGGIANARALHEARFLSECFPKGTGFPDVTVPEPAMELPAADVRAFSIDDVTTTEIDDAISVTPIDDATVRIGIHIAAPGFGIQRGDALDAIARQRLSTVYFPGDKITMLPESVVDRYTLQEGRACPALSLYATVDRATWTVTASETRCESVTVAANLRHNLLDDVITAEALADGSGDYPFKAELAVLWPFACALYDGRQQARIASGLKPEGAQKGDYSFYIDPIPEAEGGGEQREGIRVGAEDVDQRAKTTQCAAYPLSEDRCFANSGVGDTQIAVFGVEPFKYQIHVAELADIFAEGEKSRVRFEEVIEKFEQHNSAVHNFGLFVVARGNGRCCEGVVFGFAVQMRCKARFVEFCVKSKADTEAE